MVMSGDQNQGRNHSIKIDKSFFERLEELETILTKQNSIQEKLRAN
jgi:hypothetical protein